MINCFNEGNILAYLFSMLFILEVCQIPQFDIHVIYNTDKMGSQNKWVAKILVFAFFVCIVMSQQSTQQQNEVIVNPQIVKSQNQQPAPSNQQAQPQVVTNLNPNPVQNTRPNEGIVPPTAQVGTVDPVIAQPITVEPTPSNEVIVTNANPQVQVQPQVQSSGQTAQPSHSAGQVITLTVNQNSNNVAGEGQPPIQQQAQPNSHQPQNYDEPNADRSARYRAQQQRLNQIRRRQQQQYEARVAQEKQKQQIKLSKTQQVRNAQRNQFRNVLAEQPIGVPKKTVLFQVDYKIDEFLLYPATDVDVFIKMTVYILQNNAYGIVRDVTTSGTAKVYVYEDSARIVAQGMFYFEKALKFKAKAKSVYTIRFYNEGSTKLISFTYPNFLEQTHVENLYSQDKKNLHIWKTQILGLRAAEVTQRLKRNSMMDRANNETMMDFLRKYSGYQFVEMLLVILVTGFQVHLIKKMFKTDSIL